MHPGGRFGAEKGLPPREAVVFRSADLVGEFGFRVVLFRHMKIEHVLACVDIPSSLSEKIQPVAGIEPATF